MLGRDVGEHIVHNRVGCTIVVIDFFPLCDSEATKLRFIGAKRSEFLQIPSVTSLSIKLIIVSFCSIRRHEQRIHVCGDVTQFPMLAQLAQGLLPSRLENTVFAGAHPSENQFTTIINFV